MAGEPTRLVLQPMLGSLIAEEKRAWRKCSMTCYIEIIFNVSKYPKKHLISFGRHTNAPGLKVNGLDGM